MFFFNLILFVFINSSFIVNIKKARNVFMDKFKKLITDY